MTVVEQSSPRTYPIPKSVIASAVQGYRWARAYEVEVPLVYQHTAQVLTAGGSVDEIELDRLGRMWSSLGQKTGSGDGFSPGEEGYPSATRVLASLAGGEECQEWVNKIQADLTKKNEITEQSVLASIGYDPDKYLYLGLCATASPDVVEMLVRVPYDTEESWSQWDGDWSTITFQELRNFEAVEPNDSIVASIVDSLSNGDRLILSYADPVAWLPTSGSLVASAVPDDVEGEHIYAVVDETDTTAVLAAIKVTAGPRVAIRADGDWAEDEEMSEWFRSDQPPTLVKLEPKEADPVLAQIDAIYQNEIFDALKEARSITDDEFEDSTEIASVLARMSRRLKDRLRNLGPLQAAAVYQELESEVAALEAIVAARSVKGRLAWERNEGNWRRLRRYWESGKGAAKIRWGTRGDWRRCRRQLFKYLGPRAAGYCQNTHKRKTGLYTGDKLHREGVNSIRGAASTETPDFSNGIMIALYPPSDAANKIALPSPDGLPAEELHVTLAFLGNVEEYTEESSEPELIERITDVVSGFGDLEGTYQGKGIFVNEDETVTWLSPDIPKMPELRQLILDAIGDDWHVRKNHGFTPHTTLGYGDMLDDVVVEQVPVTFNSVSVVWGSNRYDIPFVAPTDSGEEPDD